MLSTYPTCGSIVLGTIKCHVSHGAGEGGDAMRYGAEDRGGAKPPLASLFHPAWYGEYMTFEALTEDMYQPSMLGPPYAIIQCQSHQLLPPPLRYVRR
jgi:hypothetical protein